MNRPSVLEALNDWNFWGSFEDESKPRPFYMEKLEELIESEEIVVVKGVRRAGKSTLTQQYLSKRIKDSLDPEKTLFVKMDDPRLSGMDFEDLNELYEIYREELQKEPEIVVLDEAQLVEGWEKFAKLLHEAHNIQVIVTGSSSKLLSEEYSSLLAGRHVDMEVLPLSFSEYLDFNEVEVENNAEAVQKRHKLKNLFKEYLEWGGFPKVAQVEEKQKQEILNRYFEDILIKDVQQRYNIRKTQKLRELTENYLSDLANPKSYKKMSETTDLSIDTVRRFSKYLETARFLLFTKKFSYSHKKQVLNPRKVYCIDNGLRNIGGFRFSKDRGYLLENVIFLELFKQNKEIYYWNKNKEADFVVKNGENITEIVNVCYSLENPDTRQREIESLMEASEQTGCEKLTIYTFKNHEKIEHEEKTIEIKPAWKELATS